MWVLTDDGCAINLSQATKIYCTPFSGHYMVEATFIDSTITLKVFDNEVDAKAFIFVLVNSLNGNGNKPDDFSSSSVKDRLAVNNNIKDFLTRELEKCGGLDFPSAYDEGETAIHACTDGEEENKLLAILAQIKEDNLSVKSDDLKLPF